MDITGNVAFPASANIEGRALNLASVNGKNGSLDIFHRLKPSIEGVSASKMKALQTYFFSLFVASDTSLLIVRLTMCSSAR